MQTVLFFNKSISEKKTHKQIKNNVQCLINCCSTLCTHFGSRVSLISSPPCIDGIICNAISNYLGQFFAVPSFNSKSNTNRALRNINLIFQGFVGSGKALNFLHVKIAWTYSLESMPLDDFIFR